MQYIFISVILFLFVIIFVAIIYNKLISKKNLMLEAWNSIDVYLKKRVDMIPNLVNTVKGYAKHESETLENLTKLRVNRTDLPQQIDNAEYIDRALANVLVVAENYPDLKSNQNFIHLQQELSQLEKDISLARRYYNGTVREYNNAAQIFPNNLIASMFNFQLAQYYNIPDTEKQLPVVNF